MAKEALAPDTLCVLERIEVAVATDDKITFAHTNLHICFGHSGDVNFVVQGLGAVENIGAAKISDGRGAPQHLCCMLMH